MLSRQCRARLSYSDGLSTRLTISRTVATPRLLRPRPSTRLSLQSRVDPIQRSGYTRHYAQLSTPPPQDSSSLSSFSHHPPSLSGSGDLPAHCENLRVHLAASFLPFHQPLTTPPSPTGPQLSQIVHESEDGTSSRQATFAFPVDDGLGESVIGIVSPFEGGDCYNRDAVLQAAAHLGADVVRIDLALAIGLAESVGIKGASHDCLQKRTSAVFSEMGQSCADCRCSSPTRQDEPLVGRRKSRRRYRRRRRGHGFSWR